jgi:drug/metabolite transporter (DMT)-like permease
MTSRSQSAWILLALTAASIEPIIVKLGYQLGASTWQLIAYRNVFAAAAILCVTGIGAWSGKAPRLRWLGWRDIRLVATVAVLLLITNGLVLLALKHMSAVSVITVVTTTPAFVAIVNQYRGRDVLGLRFWVGFAACFLGVLLSVGALDAVVQSFSLLGVGALVLAVASSTTYRTRLEYVTRQVAPRDVSIYIFAINALLSSLLIMPWVPGLPTPAVPMTAWIGVAAAIANLAFLSAIKIVGSTRMSIFDMLQRPLVIVAAALLLQEPLTWLQMCGVALVLVGVPMAKVTRKDESTRREQLLDRRAVLGREERQVDLKDT